MSEKDVGSARIGKGHRGQALLYLPPSAVAYLGKKVSVSNGEAFLCLEKGEDDPKACPVYSKRGAPGYGHCVTIPTTISGKWAPFRAAQSRMLLAPTGKILVEKPDMSHEPIRRRRTKLSNAGKPESLPQIAKNEHEASFNKVRAAIAMLNELVEKGQLTVSVRNGKIRATVQVMVG